MKFLRVFLLASLSSIVGCDRLDSDVQSDRFARTKSSLNVYGNAIDKWIEGNGRLPKDGEIESLVSTKIDPQDGWGQKIIYRENIRTNNTKYLLYSIGANGSDDFGKEDDIVYLGM